MLVSLDGKRLNKGCCEKTAELVRKVKAKEVIIALKTFLVMNLNLHIPNSDRDDISVTERYDHIVV
jgi:hypothetical protein